MAGQEEGGQQRAGQLAWARRVHARVFLSERGVRSRRPARRQKETVAGREEGGQQRAEQLA